MNIDRIGQGLFFGSLAFIIFLGGAIVAIGEVFPYSYINHAYRAGVALYRQQTQYATPYQTDLWHPARTDARGVTVYDPAQSASGYTLYTSGDGPYARLINMKGNVVHEWRRPFSTIRDERSPVEAPRPDEFIYMRKAKVFPNGDLLAIYIASGDTPWGYGMAKLDRNSEVIWQYPGRAHHDFDIADDGRIYALTHEFVDPGALQHLKAPYLDDFLVVLSAGGEERKKISLTKALVESRYAGMLFAIPHYATADPLHTNTVARLSRKEAAAIPNASAGDVLLSFREMSAIAVLDTQTEKIVWATQGPWVNQHDPSVLANNNILMFDNKGAYKPGNASRVLEFNPRTNAVPWQYGGTPQRPLDSRIRGAVQRLGNGNTLVTESNGGRLVEVTPEGEVVWEYVNPVRGGDRGRQIPAVSWGQRIKASQFAPAFREALTAR